MEIWDAYFRDGTPANRDLVRGEPIPDGLYHLVSEILVRHADGDYLLMQRDLNKATYAGYFEATAGGAAIKGEDALACAKRELWEETGITALSYRQIGYNLSRHGIFYNFLCLTDCDKDAIRLQEGETISYRWLNEKAFIDFIHSDRVIPFQKEHFSDFFREMGYLK